MKPAEQYDAALQTIRVVADCIRDITLANSDGLGGVPSGHLWARLDGRMTFETYTSIIGILKRAGLIEERSHLLIWKGPTC